MWNGASMFIMSYVSEMNLREETVKLGRYG